MLRHLCLSTAEAVDLGDFIAASIAVIWLYCLSTAEAVDLGDILLLSLVAIVKLCLSTAEAVDLGDKRRPYRGNSL